MITFSIEQINGIKKEEFLNILIDVVCSIEKKDKDIVFVMQTPKLIKIDCNLETFTLSMQYIFADPTESTFH